MSRNILCEPLDARRLLAAGHGLSASYFDNADFTGAVTRRTNARVDLNLAGHARPAPGIKGNTYSVLWAGLIRPTASETYTFSIYHNDGVRLWIDGKLVIDDWKAQARTTDRGTVALRARHYYDLRLEYFDSERTAAVALKWQSASTPQAVVPSARLYAYDDRVGVIGDFGFTNADARGVAARVHGWDPDLIATVGDNSYNDSYAKDVGTFYGDYVSSDAKANRMYPALGNHDWDYEGKYEAYFSALPGNKRYYDYARGLVHYFVVDSDPHEPDGNTADSKQGQWLKAALAKSTSTYNVVYFHHPPYSSGKTHGSSEFMRWPFKAWGADVILSGHDHDYERLYEDGLTYFVDGDGAGDRNFGTPLPGSIVRDDQDAGAMLIQANAQAMTFTYERRDGTVVDHYTLTPRHH